MRPSSAYGGHRSEALPGRAPAALLGIVLVAALLVPVGPPASATVAQESRVAPESVAPPPVVPDDPLWPDQWGLRTTFVDQVWAHTTGDPDTVVAVLSTG